MSKIHSPNVEQIKKELIGEVGTYLDQLSAAQSDVADHYRTPDTRHAAVDLMAPPLKDGVTVEDVAALLAKDNATLTAELEKSKAAAVKNSAAAKDVLNAQAAHRLEGLQAVAGRALPAAPAALQLQLLNKPFLIWANPPSSLEESEIVPSNSWAKGRMRSDHRHVIVGFQISFYYLWTNPRDTYLLADVHAYLTFNGYAFVTADSGFFPNEQRYAKARVTGSLFILEWWNQPPTSPPGQASQQITAANLSVDTSGWDNPGAIGGGRIFRGYDLSYTQLIAPPGGTVVFRVLVNVFIETGTGGSAEVDFASGDFQVGSPAILVQILS